ncbi:MAG TPA: hypothetical protein VGE35_00170 [Candidatus Paceibacterota bacterium]
MIANFLKTRIGIALLIAIIFVIIAIAYKVSSKTAQPSDISQKIQLIASESVKRSIADGSYDFEDTLNILGSSTDQAIALQEPDSSSISGNAATVTATDRFARELFTKYADAKKNGQNIDELTQNEIAELVLSNDYSSQMKLISETDLNIRDDSSRSALRAYGNALGSALSIPAVAGDHELIILERAREIGGFTNQETATLAKILARYKAISESLMEMAVPRTAGSAHAALINGVNLLANGTEGIIELFSDPVGSLTKIKLYENGINLVSAGVLKSKVNFMNGGVIFSSTEGGYKITQ